MHKINNFNGLKYFFFMCVASNASKMQFLNVFINLLISQFFSCRLLGLNIKKTHLPHFVIIISVPIWWNSDHKSEFCNFTSAPGNVNRGGIGWNCRVGKIDEYGSRIIRNEKLTSLFLDKLIYSIEEKKFKLVPKIYYNF